MKIVDKYLLRQYLVPFGYCFATFSLMYIVFDLFDRLGDLMQAKVGIAQIALFYFHYLLTINGNSSFIVLVLPISLLLGALYSLSQLTRHNEFTAMRASGMSLSRLMRPFLLFSLACSLVSAVIQETVAPQSSRWTQQFAKQMRAH